VKDPEVDPMNGYLVVDRDDERGHLYVVEPGCIVYLEPTDPRGWYACFEWSDPNGQGPGIQHEPDADSRDDGGWYCYEHPDDEYPGEGPLTLEQALAWLWKHGPHPQRLLLVEDGDRLVWVSP